MLKIFKLSWTASQKDFQIGLKESVRSLKKKEKEIMRKVGCLEKSVILFWQGSWEWVRGWV